MEMHFIIYSCVKEKAAYLEAYSTAWVIGKALQNQGIKPRLIGLLPGEPLPNYIFSNTRSKLNVYIINHPIPSGDLYRLYNGCSNVCILGHHKETRRQVEELRKKSIDVKLLQYLDCKGECSAIKAWHHWFKNSNIPLFLRYIQCYVFELEEFEDTEKVMYSYNVLGINFRTFNRFYKYGDVFVEVAKSYAHKEIYKSKYKIDKILHTVDIGNINGYEQTPYARLYGVDRLYIEEVKRALNEAYPKAKFVGILLDESVLNLYANKKHEKLQTSLDMLKVAC